MSTVRRPSLSVPAPAPALRARAAPPTPSDETLEAFACGTEPSLPQLGAPVAPDIEIELRELESRLDRCLATIAMHVQPIVVASSRARFGYEAVLRATDQALPHPGAIIDAAERLERVHVLGRAIRSGVAKVVAEAPSERGLIFLSLHLLDLSDKQLTSSFAPLSKVASRVCLEITERTSLDGENDIQYKVAELRDLGFKIAIARSGLSGPRSAPLDTDFVKLDASLVCGIHEHPVNQRLVRSLAESCHEHGTQVIGEEVADEAEAQMLAELGVDLLQGHLVGGPALPFCDPL